MRHYAQDHQLWVVSHAGPLQEVLSADGATRLIELDKELGETFAHDQDLFDTPGWKWPGR
jgi:predicted ATPase